jgi:multiple sugar transport system substrate-binding protein
MKRRILTFMLAAIMIVLLPACATTTNTPTSTTEKTQAPSATEKTETTAETDEKVVIQFANYSVLEDGYEQFWNGVKEGFEAKNTNIEIEFVSAPYGEIVNLILNMAASGERIDMAFGELDWIPTFQSAGLTVPVDTIMTQEFLDDIYPAVLDAMEIDGSAYAIPMYISPYVLYYNKDLFVQAGLDPESPPKTYDEMLQMAQKLSQLTTEDGNKVYAFGQTTASVPVSGASITSMIYNFGGRLLTSEGKLDAQTQAFKDAINMIKLLDDKGYNPQNAKLKDLRNLFALGQLAMYYDQSWGFNGVEGINPDAKNFTASAAPLSGGSGTGESILQSEVLFLMDNGEEQTAAVRTFVEYIVSQEVLNESFLLTPAYPAMQSMKDMEVVVNSPVLKGAASSLSKTVPSTFIPTLSELNLELCTLAQAVTLGDQDVGQAIEEFIVAANAVIED